MWPASRFRLRYFGRNIRFRGGVCTLGAVSIRTDECGDPGLNFPRIGSNIGNRWASRSRAHWTVRNLLSFLD